MAQFDPKDPHRFLHSERYRWQNPEVILDALGLRPGMILADVGAGEGFFALPAARRVGDAGRVYALDIDPKRLERLGERAASEKVGNVECLVSRNGVLPLADAMADTALLANVLHEVSTREQLLREIARVLKPEGILAVVEWKKEQMQMGPPLSERLSYEDVEGALRLAGFAGIELFEVGPYHYGVKARTGKASEGGKDHS